MGTPHMGSAKAEWAGVLTRFSNVLRTTNRNIVAVLEPGSEVLAALQQDFHTMLEDRSRNLGSRLEIYCFYEEVAVTGMGRGVSACFFRSVHRRHVLALCDRDSNKHIRLFQDTQPSYQHIRTRQFMAIT